jgi:hypothetical protein
MDISGIDLSRLNLSQKELAPLERLLAFIALTRGEKNGKMLNEVTEDLRYLTEAHQDFEDDPQLRAAVLSAINEIALNLEDTGRVNSIRRTSGLISFAHESDESYDPWRARRLCRLAAEAVNATPLIAPVVISKLSWKLQLHYASGVNIYEEKPALAQSELVRGLRNQVLQVVITARFNLVIAGLTEQLYSRRGRKLIDTAFYEVCEAGADMNASDHTWNDDEALLCSVLKHIGQRAILERVIATFSEQEINVLSPLFARLSTEFGAAMRDRLHEELKGAFTSDEIERLIAEPRSEWAEAKFSKRERGNAGGCSVCVDLLESLSGLYMGNTQLLTEVVSDAFNALKAPDCPPNKWGAIAKKHLLVLSLPAATRLHVSYKVLVEGRYEPHRKNPFLARCTAPERWLQIPVVRFFVVRLTDNWIIEPNVPVLRSKQLPQRPAHCTAFESVEIPEGTEQSPDSGARFIDAPLAFAITVAARVRAIRASRFHRISHTAFSFLRAGKEKVTGPWHRLRHRRSRDQRDRLSVAEQPPLSKIARRQGRTNHGWLRNSSSRVRRIGRPS